ncbi:hypothetical protein EWM64_g6978 [Hericium alpestre]|uniref:DUF6533 domain-containing protein n=1 Tax=Hericium alpestre TaxID=135208 RepID=A0A4Y9ZR22_9AGAM|nr:hypothetical protein EWM64_g6978 [Hericium alpestre]
MSSIAANDSLNIVAFIVLYYDYVLTLPMEFECYWQPGSLNLASGIFFVNRYVALAGHIPIVYQCFVPMPDDSHRNILTALLLTMRMYALYNRNKCVLGVMTILAVVALAVIGWIISVEVMGSQEAPLTEVQGQHIAAAWAALLAFDTVVFGLTIDGIIYYIVIFSVNLINILLWASVRDNDLADDAEPAPSEIDALGRNT